MSESPSIPPLQEGEEMTIRKEVDRLIVKEIPDFASMDLHSQCDAIDTLLERYVGTKEQGYVVGEKDVQIRNELGRRLLLMEGQLRARKLVEDRYSKK